MIESLFRSMGCCKEDSTVTGAGILTLLRGDVSLHHVDRKVNVRMFVVIDDKPGIRISDYDYGLSTHFKSLRKLAFIHEETGRRAATTRAIPSGPGTANNPHGHSKAGVVWEGRSSISAQKTGQSRVASHPRRGLSWRLPAG